MPPEVVRIDVEYTPHEEGAKQIQALFGVGPELLRDGEGWAVDTFTLLGTHRLDPRRRSVALQLDDPGQAGRDDRPASLDWFFRPGSCWTSTSGPTARWLKSPTSRQNFSGPDMKLRNGTSACPTGVTGTSAPRIHGTRPRCGARPPRAGLYDRGVRVMGTDAWGWDRLPGCRPKRRRRWGGRDLLGGPSADIPYSQSERLANLDQLPATGFTVACFPLKLVGGSAAPARVVAIIDQGSG